MARLEMKRWLAGAARPAIGAKMPAESNSKTRIVTIEDSKMIIDEISTHFIEYAVTI